MLSFNEFKKYKLEEAREVLQHLNQGYKNPRGFAVDNIHNHPNLRPLGLSQAHIDAIKNYSTSPREKFKDFVPTPGHNSRAMNSYLKDKAQGKVKNTYEGQPVTHIEKGISNLKSVFTPENTNKSNVIIYSGIPASIGNKLKKSNSMSYHVFSAFTSFTSSKTKAIDFAVMHNEEENADLDEPKHILRVMASPGTVLSVAHHSLTSDSENELISHPDSVLVYFDSKLDDVQNVVTHNMTLSGHK